MDVYLPGPGAQIHDLNPTTFPPVGLFWTLQISDERQADDGNGVDIETGSGRATLRVKNAPIFDYGDINNALFGGGPAPVAGEVSFTVQWNGVNQRVNIRNTDPVFGGFAGEFVRNSAQMEWSARVGDLVFESDAMGTSSSSFAEIGHERNGVFFS